MMKCGEFVDFILAYLGEELPVEQRDEFRRHIGDCPPCLTYLDTYRESVEAGKMAYGDPEAECGDVPERLIQAILAARKKSPA